METSSLAADIFSVRMEDNSAAEMSPFFATTGVAWKARCTTHAGRPTQRVRGSGESPEACCPPALTRDTAIRPTPRTAPTRTDSNSLLGGEVHQRPSDLPPHEGQARGRAGGERGGTFPPPRRMSAGAIPHTTSPSLPRSPSRPSLPPTPAKSPTHLGERRGRAGDPAEQLLGQHLQQHDQQQQQEGQRKQRSPSPSPSLRTPPGIERDSSMEDDLGLFRTPGISMESEWWYRGGGESPRARRWLGKARINSVSDLFSLRAFSHSSEGQR